MSHIQMPSIFAVACHTNNVGPGTTFVAIAGQKANGVSYIAQALEKGATRIVVQNDAQLSDELVKTIEDSGVVLTSVDDARKALAELSAQAYGYPADQLTLIGITGTKGKTTTAYLLEHVLRSAGHTTALLSTVANKIGDTWLNTQLTTQQPDYLHAFFNLCVQQGVTTVVMEVAAQAVTLHRIAGLTFDGIIFTNFEKEHSEFYPTIDEYFAAKCQLFNAARAGAPILINADDDWGQKILQCATQEGRSFVRFGITTTGNDISAEMKESSTGVLFDLLWQGSAHQVTCPLFAGRFNTYNVLASLGMAVSLGIPLCVAGQSVGSCCQIPGRMQEQLLPNGARAFIDYAHTPASYQQVLSALRTKTDHIIAVFGAGGERDHSKRPLLGKIAAQMADRIFITSDNPRSEDPAEIAQQIIAGIPEEYMHKVTLELDREEAVRKAYAYSTPISCIVLFGKGPDEYQQIGLTRHAFSERRILQDL